MIPKINAKMVNTIFEYKNWIAWGLVCAFCKTMFHNKPFVYTWLDGMQSLACSKKCHAAIKREDK